MDGAVPDKPTLPDERLLGLRRLLIQEECAEVDEAFEQLSAEPTQSTLAHLIHECADLLYVTYGAMVSLGVDADAVFAEVHRANMQKASGPRRADGKVLKPKNFVPADVFSVIYES